MTVARIGGVPLTVHPSWVISFALLTWFSHEMLAAGPLPLPSNAMLWTYGAAIALGLAVCIVAHEFAHVAIARAYGLPVRGVTLFAFGGVSQIDGEAPSARAEFRLAVAGPLASILISGVLAASARLLHGEGLQGALGVMALFNLVVAGFNLIPAFPMDGGRVLRSALWAGGRDRARATRWAVIAGKGFAFLLMGAGGALVVTSLGSDAEGAPSGLYSALIGLFLFRASDAAGIAEGAARPRPHVGLPLPGTNDPAGSRDEETGA